MGAIDLPTPDSHHACAELIPQIGDPMKKAKVKKLTLHRETVKSLDEGQLKGAAGASDGISNCYTCLSACYFCDN